MASIMRLRPEHKQYHMVTNPLVVDAEELAPEEIEELVAAFNDNPTDENRSAAVFAFCSIIRHIVGRHIGTFRSLRSMEDDLVSEALITVMKSIDDHTDHVDVCRVVSNRIMRDLTRHINKYRTVTAPFIHKQHKLLKEGKDVLYAVVLDDSHDQAQVDENLLEFEFLSTIYNCDLTELERRLLEPENWGLSPDELCIRLDVSRRTVFRALKSLVTKAKEVLYAD